MSKQPYRTKHYQAIHRRVTRRVWNELSIRQREIIAHDTDHSTETFRRFESAINSETDRCYNDPEFFYNNPYSFRVSYHGET